MTCGVRTGPGPRRLTWTRPWFRYRLPDKYTRSGLDVLVDQLRDRHLLLILDTCEHLLGACAALVSALLPPCPKMQVLATSREPLRVPGEATVAVRPLRLTGRGGTVTRQAPDAAGRDRLEPRAAHAGVFSPPWSTGSSV
jgi:predicted ATPase